MTVEELETMAIGGMVDADDNAIKRAKKMALIGGVFQRAIDAVLKSVDSSPHAGRDCWFWLALFRAEDVAHPPRPDGGGESRRRALRAVEGTSPPPSRRRAASA
jgi:hypothetical protein